MIKKAVDSFALRIAIFIALLVLAAIFKKGIFDNIAWIFYGVSLIVHPCWPKMWDHANREKMRLGCRIAGALAVLVGIFTRFGV